MNIFVTFIKLYSAQEKLLSTNQVSYFPSTQKFTDFAATLNNPHLFTTERAQEETITLKITVVKGHEQCTFPLLFKDFCQHAICYRK